MLSEFGDWAGQIALAILVFDETGSGFYAAATFAVRVLPWLGLGQFIANRSTRFPVRRFLAVADVIRAIAYMLLLLPIPVPLMLLIALIAGSFGPAFRVRQSSLIPEIVGDDDYPDAVSLQHATGQTMLLAGYALGGALVAVTGARVALAINAATFLWSAVLVSGMTHLAARKWPRDEPPSIRDGFRIVVGDPLLRRAVSIAGIAGGCAFAVEATAVIYTAEELGGGAGLVGLFTSAVAASSALAVAVWAMPKDDPGMLRRSALLCTLGALGAGAAFALPDRVPIALVGFLLVGLIFAGAAPANASANRRAPANKRPAVLGVMAGFVFGCEGIGALVGGMISEVADPHTANLTAMCIAAVVSLYGLVRPIDFPDDAVMPGDVDVSG